MIVRYGLIFFEEKYFSFKDFDYKYFELSENIYRTCRKKGKTIRKSIDCLIAANAMIDNLTVIHVDRDFTEISKVFPELKIF